MAELNLKQIEDKLNSEFKCDSRKLIFWHDDNGEFESDIDLIELENAKILRLEKDNQFHIKYVIEREDTKTNFLIYAPFPKPAIRDNHLSDTIRYSKEFYADKASLLLSDLGINEKYKVDLQKYSKFFNSKERTKKFYELEIEKYNTEIIETGLMAVLCKSKRASFEEVLRIILESNDFSNDELSSYLSEFKKYDLLDAFWKRCEERFAYADTNPNLTKLVYTLFVTYTSKVLGEDLPKAWMNFNSFKAGNIMTFIDSLMNNVNYRDTFRNISIKVYSDLNGKDVLLNTDKEKLLEYDLFSDVDKILIKWMIDRLEDRDISVKLGVNTIPEICKIRSNMHFSEIYKMHYKVIENAYYILKSANFEPKKEIEDLIKSYTEEDYLIDQSYRYFYYYYDKLIENIMYESLRELIENIYTNNYLDVLSAVWTRKFEENKGHAYIKKQKDFYNNYLKNAKERIVVIISDALRYEVGKTLAEKLEYDEKCSVSLTPMMSVLPSYTRFGMSALLPHKELFIDENFEVITDGKMRYDLKTRAEQLKAYVEKSKAIQFDDIKDMKISELKEIFTGQDLVYVYHNQIDIRGDEKKTENEVFNACEEAIEELYTVIKRLTSANNTHFIITSDHGFIYKRDKLIEGAKISGFNKSSSVMNKRYILSDENINLDGVASVKSGDILSNDDERYISYPVGSDIFKLAGGGQNFVHGGASLQELIIPVIDVKTSKSYTETKPASIGLVTILNKITNLTVNVDFIQSDAVSDIYKETTYRIYFVSEDGEKISNDNVYVADKRDLDDSKRLFRFKFIFKNKKYDKNIKHYLLAYDEKNSVEVIRREVQMDLAFVDDFGF